MIVLEVVYDARFSSKRDPFYYARDHSYTIATVRQCSEGEDLQCRHCLTYIIPACSFLWVERYRKRRLIYECYEDHAYCKNCCTEAQFAKGVEAFQEIDWDRFPCHGDCGALHATWSMCFPHLTREWKIIHDGKELPRRLP